MSPAKKAAHRMVAEIDADELAVRIAIACTGTRPPMGMKPAEALRQMDALAVMPGVPLMGTGFRKAAHATMAYWRECIAAGQVPS